MGKSPVIIGTTLLSLNASIEELYIAENKQINIKIDGSPFIWHVVLLGRDKEPDCKVSSWSANLWFRTPKGVNRMRYKSLSILQREIIRAIESKIDIKGAIHFSISNEVLTL